MNVSHAVEQRVSIRRFKPEAPSADLVRDILERASRAPSGGNLQPWRVFALTGEPLAQLKALIAAEPPQAEPEYAIYPPNLWEPFRTRRFQNAEDLYATIGIAREHKAERLQQMGRNAEFFGAPVGIFVCIDRGLGPPQWADLGIYMQTVMLLAVERGLDTCPQEYWANRSKPVSAFLKLPPELMLFAGIALGWRDETAPINRLRARRDPFESWGEMIGF
ncbi:nitroreductase [Variovorax sp. PBL-E5]|uniref:nitroreductase n=1 Tax=Variovorax sp. PBL-E5 TaxID=434014 RepID=UPI001316B507|nr:nitroreductase [Variovorax sp. PBL-E5]VTU16315.1 5,6-dimethylbenzimidazole synthase [Variovorax sp. PBL-E5]